MLLNRGAFPDPLYAFPTERFWVIFQNSKQNTQVAFTNFGRKNLNVLHWWCRLFNWPNTKYSNKRCRFIYRLRISTNENSIFVNLWTSVWEQQAFNTSYFLCFNKILIRILNQNRTFYLPLSHILISVISSVYFVYGVYMFFFFFAVVILNRILFLCLSGNNNYYNQPTNKIVFIHTNIWNMNCELWTVHILSYFCISFALTNIYICPVTQLDTLPFGHSKTNYILLYMLYMWLPSAMNLK